MLLRGLSWLVVFQLVGTALNVLFSLSCQDQL